MSTVTSKVGKFVWREQVSDDPEKAKDFYTELFGWGTETFQPGEVDYTMIAAGGTTHGGFGKAQEGAPPPHWLSHIHVENVDETIEKAKGAGGKVAFGPMEMPNVGRMAVIGDPQGGYVGIYQPEGEGPSGDGVFVWESSRRATPTPRSASTRRSSVGRPPTWAPITAATGSSTAARPVSPG